MKTNKNEEKRWCIYMHTNKINNKKYVGMTSCKPIYRWLKGNGYKTQLIFYKDIQKYGWENFEHEILYEGLLEDEAKTKEIEIIKLYDTTNMNLGYNLSTGGDSFNGIIVTEDTKRKISKTKEIKIVQLDAKGKLIKIWNSGREAEIDGGFNTCCIAGCCTHKLIGHKGYKWMHLSEYEKLSSEQILQLCRNEKPNYHGKIIQLDLNYKIIKEWNSLIEASRVGGFNSARISDCCLKKQKTHLGFIWMHYNDYILSDNFILDKDA